MPLQILKNTNIERWSGRSAVCFFFHHKFFSLALTYLDLIWKLTFKHFFSLVLTWKHILDEVFISSLPLIVLGSIYKKPTLWIWLSAVIMEYVVDKLIYEFPFCFHFACRAVSFVPFFYNGYALTFFIKKFPYICV